MIRALPSLLVAAALFAGCGGDFSDDYNLIDRLRVIAVKAEPAEVAPGDRVRLTAWALDPVASPIEIHWAACTEPPLPGTGTINADCVTVDAAPYLVPLGDGAMVMATVPAVSIDLLGAPDSTGGLYLPIRLRVSAPGDALDVIERLRIARGGTQNHNPVLASISSVTEAPDGGAVTTTTLAESPPLPVSSGDQITLRAHFADGSVESYVVDDGVGAARSVTETLSVSWFSTAGHFSSGSTGADVDTKLTLDRHLPASGGAIDLWAVGRDERGGLDVLHRALILR